MVLDIEYTFDLSKLSLAIKLFPDQELNVALLRESSNVYVDGLVLSYVELSIDALNSQDLGSDSPPPTQIRYFVTICDVVKLYINSIGVVGMKGNLNVVLNI